MSDSDAVYDVSIIKDAYAVNMQVDGSILSLRERLIDEGLALLATGAEPSLRAVARAAGVSAMAPYRHFADKEALLAAMAGRGFALFHAALLAADSSSPDPREALVRQGIAYTAFARSQPAMFRLMFGGGIPKPTPPEKGDAAFDILGHRVASLVPPARRQAVALACWGMVHGLATLARDGQLPEDGVALDAKVRLAAEALLDGIGG